MITYEKEAFKNLLDEFAKKVKEKHYNKLHYSLWRNLYDLCKLSDGVNVQIDKNCKGEINLDIFPNRLCEERRRYEFDIEDSSFGEFLNNELYNSNLQPKVDELGTITFDTCVFGEPTANKTVIGYHSIKDEPRLEFSTSGIGIAYGKQELDSLATMSDLSITRERVEELGKMVQDHINKDKIFNERKENGKMKGFNFDFGSCEGSNVRMSMYGMAVKNASGIWVAYDKENEQIMDVDILNFEGSKYMYKMPVALKDIAKADIVIHSRKPMFVTEVHDKKLVVIDPFDGEEKVILPAKSCFGFDFVTKVVCLFDGFCNNQKANEDNPFGNLWMLMMCNENDDSILPMLMMAQQGTSFNPMLFYMMNKNTNEDLLPLLLMGQNFLGQNK